MSKPYFVDLRQLRTGLGRMNHGLFTWIIHSWIMAGCGTTGEQHIVLGKRIFYSASFSVEELNEIGENEFESRRFLNVRFKKLSTNQNRGITWLSQGCSNTTLGTRLMKLCKCGYPPRANCRDCLDSIPPKNIYICKYQGRGKYPQ